jgi:hypothetical protein
VAERSHRFEIAPRSAAKIQNREGRLAFASAALTDVRRGQAVVAVGRVLPAFWDVRPQQFEENEVEYWAVGVLRLDEEFE